jgi:hypothetical protein
VRRGGRSSLGRGSAWPRVMYASQALCLTLYVVGWCIVPISSLSVGLGLVIVGVLGWLGAEAYNVRWLRLQDELFKRREPS